MSVRSKVVGPLGALLLTVACSGSGSNGNAGSGGSASSAQGGQSSEDAKGGNASGGATTSAGATAGGTNGGGASSARGGSAGSSSTSGGVNTASGGSGGSVGVNPNDPTDDGLIGWATRHTSGAPSGGSLPLAGNPVMTCTATNMKTLRDCLFRAKKSDKTNTDTRPNPPDWASWEVHSGVTGGWKKYPLVIYVKGIIDASQNDAGHAMTKADYEAGDPLCGSETGAGCQQALIQAKVERGDVSVIGIPGDNGEVPTLDGGWLMFRGQENIIVRNLRVVNATDYWPSLESCAAGVTDQDYCAWNAEPDGLTLDNAQRVWIDHCEFTDGAAFDGVNPDKTRYKMYDGLLDIKNGSDFVTLSYNGFSNHNKAMLIGATDSPDGSYRISFHHNLIRFVQQRTPRVRNGQVHVFNNYYSAPLKQSYVDEYSFGYALGLGYNSQIYSERNAFDVPGATATNLLSANFDAWAQHFSDDGSWLNGQPIDLNAAAKQIVDARNASQAGSTPFIGPVSWKPADAYAYNADSSASVVKEKVLARAGVGKVSPDPKF
ncbi:MAG: pectate lyase family protein [Myxococcota bacterium]